MSLSTSKTEAAVSGAGVQLTREVTFKFALDPNEEQERQLLMHAGAARLAYNHHVARLRANMKQRSAERSYGINEEDLTPGVSWSKFSLINEFNAWKNGKLPSSPENEDGSRGLLWRNEVSADVFECAAVDVAKGFKKFGDYRKGERKGKEIGSPKFKSKHKSMPSFRLRNKCKIGGWQQIRVAGPKSLRLPAIGDIRIHGCTRKMRRMLENGRLHIYSASIRFERGRWRVSLSGVAAQMHHERKSKRGRHANPAGLDVGLKTLATVADSDGNVLHVVKGVKALQKALTQLKRANQAFSRTKEGSKGRVKAIHRLRRIHARIANLRSNFIHKLTHELATSLTSLTIESLNVAAMVKMRPLARGISDAAFGEIKRMLKYKAAWYGLELTEADRWFPSSKTCSTCGIIKKDLTLKDRVYECECGLIIDRDVNAAINLARLPLEDEMKEPALAA